MKWFAISGSWKMINDQVKRDVEETVKNIVSDGNGIITGGALGVDCVATEIVLEHGDSKKQLKIYLPIKLDDLCDHYFRRADEGVITKNQAEMITNQLKNIQKISPDSIFDNWGWTEADEESYYGRNSFIVRDCDELYAFQVNNSKGTQDVIDKAKKLNKPVHIRKYHIKI